MRKRAWYDIPDGYGYFDEGSYEKIFGDYSVCIYNDDIYDETENGEWSYGVYSADGNKEYKTSPERRYNSAQEAASEAEWYLRQVLHYKDAMRKRAEWWVEHDRETLMSRLEEIIEAAYRHYDSNAAQDPDGFYTGYYLGIADEMQDLISFINDKGMFRR